MAPKPNRRAISPSFWLFFPIFRGRPFLIFFHFFLFRPEARILVCSRPTGFQLLRISLFGRCRRPCALCLRCCMVVCDNPAMFSQGFWFLSCFCGCIGCLFRSSYSEIFLGDSAVCLINPSNHGLCKFYLVVFLVFFVRLNWCARRRQCSLVSLRFFSVIFLSGAWENANHMLVCTSPCVSSASTQSCSLTRTPSFHLQPRPKTQLFFFFLCLCSRGLSSTFFLCWWVFSIVFKMLSLSLSISPSLFLLSGVCPFCWRFMACIKNIVDVEREGFYLFLVCFWPFLFFS